MRLFRFLQQRYYYYHRTMREFYDPTIFVEKYTKVQCSSSKEKNSADHPKQLYAATKRSNELMAHSYSYLYNLPTTGLRFFTVYGSLGRPDMALSKFVGNIFLNKPIQIYNNGKHSRDFTYIDDAVNGILKAARNVPKKKKIKLKKLAPSESSAPFRILNIGSGKSINLLTCIKLIEKITGKKAIKKFLPIQKGDVIKTHSDLNKIKSILKYKPKISIEDGMSRFIKWFKIYHKIN